MDIHTDELNNQKEKKTVAEWRKIFKISYGMFRPLGKFVPNGQECITIKGLKTEVKNLEIPEVIGNFKVMAIDAYAFHGCKCLESVTIPSSVQKIDCSAFTGCPNLSRITIENESADIAYNAFSGCKRLADRNGFLVIHGVLQGYFGNEEHVEIPDIVTNISPNAFVRNKSVKRIIIPEGVKAIPLYAFSSCDNLEYVFVPKSVIRIGENAFNANGKINIETIADSYAEKYANENGISLLVKKEVIK